ncbi:MAG: FtsX-like permease family protein [Calditrichaeota bacterium]|nr:FtsX-like permease family protein [Calditrichota bacterium]
MNSFEFFIAKRYFKAKRKTGFISIITYVSIAGVMIGVTALILVLSVMNGFEQEVRSRLLGADAHLRIRKFYLEPITRTDSLLKLAKNTKHVIGASPVIVDKGMISGKEKQYATVVKAIDPDLASEVTDLKSKVILGKLDFTPQLIHGKMLPGIVLGRYLADALFATRIGDVVTLWTMPKEGGIFSQPRVKQFYVAGLVEIGYYEYDKTLSYISLKDARQLFGIKGVTWIELKLDNYELAGKVAAQLEEELGYPYTTETWFQLNRSLYSWMEIEKWGAFVILSLIIMVAAFNIISSLIMVVMEKTREIGILKSMGASSKSIMKIFLYEGLLVGIIGTFLGCAIGYSAGFIQLHFNVISLPPDVYLINSLPIVMEWADFVAIASISVMLSLLASLYPAYRASQLMPVEAIRYE